MFFNQQACLQCSHGLVGFHEVCSKADEWTFDHGSHSEHLSVAAGVEGSEHAEGKAERKDEEQSEAEDPSPPLEASHPDQPPLPEVIELTSIHNGK